MAIMSNPARRLAILLREWERNPDSSGITIHQIRGTEGDHRWLLQVEAAMHLAEIAQYLDARTAAGGSSLPYSNYFSRWARAVFLPDAIWSQVVGKGTLFIDSGDISMLEALAEVMDHTRPSPRLTEPQRASIGSALDDVLELMQDMDLDPAVRQFIFELVSSCRVVISEANTFGSVDLLNRIFALFGVLSDIADRIEDAGDRDGFGEKLRNVAKRLVKVVRYGTIPALGVGADLLGITDYISGS